MRLSRWRRATTIPLTAGEFPPPGAQRPRGRVAALPGPGMLRQMMMLPVTGWPRRQATRPRNAARRQPPACRRGGAGTRIEQRIG